MTVAGADRFRDRDVYGVESISATGFNRLLGDPVMNLGNYGDLGFETVAEYNSKGGDAIPLTKAAEKSALLASYVDPEFLNLFMSGQSSGSLAPDTLNVPLRDVGANSGLSGVEYKTAPPVTDVPIGILFQAAQSLPVYPITLEEWLKAKGKLSFSCKANGTSIVKMKLAGLIPRRQYTVWGFFETQESNLPFADFGPIRPLGGVSNLVVADENGEGEYKRVLNFCPMNLKKDQIPLSAVFVYFHSDLATYGAVLSHPGEGRFPGNAGHVALQFPVSAQTHNIRARTFNEELQLKIEKKDSGFDDSVELTESVFMNDPYFVDSTAPSRVIKGVAASGWNKNASGDPIGILPGGVGTFGFNTIGVFNPANGGTSTRINHDTPDSAILATFIDAENIVPRFSLFDMNVFLTQGTNNIPFHFTPIANDGTGLGRASLAGILDVGQMDYSRSEPSGPITLGQFKRAQGIVKFSCPEGELPRMVMKFKDMLPNRYYNMFEWFQTGFPLGDFDILPEYVGGLPDAFTTDEYGRGEYRAFLNRCPPLTRDADGISIGWVIVMRQNHETHATTIIAPTHPRDARLPGEIATAHMVFPLRAQPYVPQ